MIYALDIKDNKVTLYNTEADGVKVLSLTTLNSLIESRGFKLDNAEQFLQMLQGKKYKYFIRNMLSPSQMTISTIDNLQETEIVGRCANNIEELANAVSYRCLSIDEEKIQIRSITGYSFPVNYTVLAGMTYEEAMKELSSPNEALEQFSATSSLWGQTNIGWSTSEDLPPGSYLATPVPNTDSYMLEDEVELQEGVTHVGRQSLSDIKAKLVTAPSSVCYMADILELGNTKIECLDLSKASIDVVDTKFSSRGSSKKAISKAVLPNKTTTIKNFGNMLSLKAYESCFTLSSITHELEDMPGLIAEVVFIPKSVKRILTEAILAPIVIFEKGIELELVSANAIKARHMLMSDTPDLEDYLAYKRFNSNNQVTLDLGNKLEFILGHSLITIQGAVVEKGEYRVKTVVKYKDTVKIKNIQNSTLSLLDEHHQITTRQIYAED